MSSYSDMIEMLSVYGPNSESYSARTWGDIEGTVRDAIQALGIEIPEETIKTMVQDLIDIWYYKFDDYLFEVYYE